MLFNTIMPSTDSQSEDFEHQITLGGFKNTDSLEFDFSPQTDCIRIFREETEGFLDF